MAVYANLNLPSSATITISEAYMLAGDYRTMAGELTALLTARGHLLDVAVRADMLDMVETFAKRRDALEAICEDDKRAQVDERPIRVRRGCACSQCAL